LGCWHGGAANGFTDAGSAHRLGLSPNSFRGKAGARDLMGREYAVVAMAMVSTKQQDKSPGRSRVRPAGTSPARR